MDSEIKLGRRWVLAVIVASVTLSVLVMVVFNLVRGPERLPQQIARFLFTIGLCIFLYRGANWARWLTVILFAVAGVGSLIGGLWYLSAGMSGLLLMVMGSVYVASAVVLVLVPTVRAYFGAAKAKAG